MVTNNCINSYIVPSTTYSVSMPLQPAFAAYLSAQDNNVTGGGTNYNVAMDTEAYDQNSDYNTGTYTFTVPIDGVYFITADFVLLDVDASNRMDNRIKINGVDDALIDIDVIEDIHDNHYLGAQLIESLDAADAILWRIQASGGGDVCDAATWNYNSATLLY